jgi:putative endonuclease
MAGHIKLGQNGEQLAADYLQSKGYQILHRNWRHSRYEIDIIAERNGVLHIVEVKIRSSRRYGFPEETVNRKKFHSLLEAADEFLYRHPEFRHVQYDIVAISLFPNEAPEYFLIEDVYL